MERTLDAALVWFRRDLRTHDHAALYHALRSARRVWCVFVFDTQILDELPRADRRVEFILDMTIKTIRYVLEYTWNAPTGATWRLIEGDVKDVDGSYRFEETPAGVKATCTQAVDLGFWVPGFIRSLAEAKALRDSVEEFKHAVETRG